MASWWIGAVAAAAVVAQPELRDELFAMVTADQEARDTLMKSDFKDQKALAQMTALDKEHTARLKAVVAAHGWPGKSLVGEKAAHAAWLLVQHADADPAFQRRCLHPHGKAASGRGERKGPGVPDGPRAAR